MQWHLAVAIIFAAELCFFVSTGTRDSECTPPLFFKCHNTSKCISHVFVCDGDDDCGDESDEDPEKCHKELPKKCNGFECANGQCILQNCVCDGMKDCRDGSDELNCTLGHIIPSANCNNTIDKYLCANRQRCIDLALVCNNVDDCGDDSDEHPANCSKAIETCRSSPCSSVCRPTPKGYQCACGAGYILKNHTCQDPTKQKQDVNIALNDDTKTCQPNTTCASSEIKCASSDKCILQAQRCNAVKDCPDGEDEENCTDYTCDDRSFKCGNGFCIPGNWECDGQADCTDASDEHESCTPPVECDLDQFTCRNRRCVNERLKCNGIDDCHDNSDEEDCAVEALTCTGDQYRCEDSHMCIHANLRCNGKPDCPKSDDEESCGHFSDTLFKCDNGQSIPREWVCDYHFDCDDTSDEKNCSARSRPKVNCTESQFACKTGHCIALTKACDGIEHCSDGSDEGGSCDTACSIDSCEVTCHKTPNGGVCSCGRGYKLASDRKSCIAVGECEPGACSQHCTNRTGTVACSCYEGYLLRLDKVSCKATGPAMKIWTASYGGIHFIVPNKPRSPVEMFYQDYENFIGGLDVDARDETVYWSNEHLGIVNKINADKSNHTRASDGLGQPQVLVVDWITDNVYVYDAKTPANIKVCNVDTNKCSVIIRRDGPKSKVTAMAIHPTAEMLFFGQTFSHSIKLSVSEIVRTNLIGSDETSIVKDNIGIVNGIAIDHHRSLLYWLDGWNKVIECVDFDGEGREVVVKGLPSSPIELFLFEDTLYWKLVMDTLYRKLYKVALYGDTSKALTVSDGSDVNRLYVVSQVSMQPTSANLCANNNCTHLCVVHEGRPTCLCRDGTPARLRKNTACPAETIIESSRTANWTNPCSSGNGILWIGLLCGLLVITSIMGICYFCVTVKRPNQMYRTNFENVDGIRLSKWRINNNTTSTTSNSVWTTGRVFC